MSRPRPPFLQKHVTRHGKTVWYVRMRRGPRVRIPGDYGSPEFTAAYHAAVAGAPREVARTTRGATDSLEWLIGRYRDSAAWAALSAATKRQRDNIFVGVIKAVGSEPYASFTRQDIAATRDAKRATPFAANNFLKTMRGLFRWALESGFIDSDPTEGVRGAVPQTDGFHVWTEEEIEQFERRWPVGTRERLALAILLYTGLRRGDAAALGRQHIRNGVIRLRTEKTGAPIEIPLLPELAAIIAATKTGDFALIARADGAPMVKEGFGNWFRDACKAAGVPGSAHGLRKAGATRAAENGATVAELEAIFGWSGGKMAALYTRKADRARLARKAMGKLGKSDETGTSKPTPETKTAHT